MVLIIKNLLFTVVVPGTVAVYLPLFVAGRRSPASGWPLVIGGVLLAAGAAIYTWCVWDFANFGGGTPAPIAAPKKLVVRGLYHYTRNPMYVGVLSVISAWTFIFGAVALAAYAVVVAACFHAVVVLYEERHLYREYGSEYQDYCERVGRWFPKR